jgi:hypothetical protein
VGRAGSSSNKNGSRKGGNPTSALPTERAFEVSVRSGSRWKTLFKGSGSGAMSKARSQEYEEVLNARRVIEACREDIVTLWNHPAIRAGLSDQSVSLEFQSGLCVASEPFYLFISLPFSFYFACGDRVRLLIFYLFFSLTASLMRWIGLRHQDMNHPQVGLLRSLARSLRRTT